MRPVTARVCARMMQYLRAGLGITIMQLHTHTMQQTCSRRVEVKKSYFLVKRNWTLCWGLNKNKSDQSVYCQPDNQSVSQLVIQSVSHFSVRYK